MQIGNTQFTAWEFDGFEDDEVLLFPLNFKLGKQLKKTYYHQIYSELNKLNINESICKKDLIIKIWGCYDEWKDNSFRVAFNRAKKMSSKEFKGSNMVITRTA